jgi:hypothetical protein
MVPCLYGLPPSTLLLAQMSEEVWRREDGLQHHGICSLIWSPCMRHVVPKISKAGTTSGSATWSDMEVDTVDVIVKHLAALTMYDIQH